MRGATLLTVLILVSLAAVLIPYGVLGGIPSFAASYLFWSVLTLAVIVVFAFVYTSRWGRKS
ncbi:MAG: hypothetical protein GVY29_10030 [Spirochaetes bacterium]|jgi:hypothetical protein|nr:hypothetical protein [Spirochaetota bacterium]